MVIKRRRGVRIFPDVDSLFDLLENQIRRSLEFARRMLDKYELPLEEMEEYRIPLTDIIDEGDRYVIEVELPGMDKKDIQIFTRDHILEIVARRKFEKREEKEGYIRMERSYSGFRRAIELPLDADTEKIKAKYENGVLRIEIFKKAEAGRRIEIE